MTNAEYAQRIYHAYIKLLELWEMAPAEDKAFWARHLQQVDTVKHRVFAKAQQEQEAVRQDADKLIEAAIAAAKQRNQQEQEEAEATGAREEV